MVDRRLMIVCWAGLLLAAAAQPDFSGYHHMKSTGYWAGNDDEWYESEGICDLDGPQRWWTKHVTEEIDFDTRRRLEEEQAAALDNSWLPSWASTRNWKYVLQAPDEHTLEVWERDDIDVHMVYTSKDFIVTECCWYTPEYVHNYCIAGTGQLQDVGTGVDGTTKWRKEYIGGPVGRPFKGTACEGADNVITPPGEGEGEERLPGMGQPENSAPWFNMNLLHRMVDPRAPPPTKPPGYLDVNHIDLHVTGDNKLKRIDYISGGTSNQDDGTLEWYEIITMHTNTPPDDAEELLTPPEAVSTLDKCELAVGEQFRTPWTTWLWLLAAACVGGGVCAAGYYTQTQARKKEQEGFAFPKDADFGGASSGTRMSGKSGMTRGDAFADASAGTRMTGASGMTRGTDSDFGGGAGTRMTGVSGFTRGGDDDLSQDPAYFSDNPGNRMTGISGFTRGTSSGSRRSKGSKTSKSSKSSKRSRGSRRSKGSRHGGGGSRRSKGGRSTGGSIKHH